MRRFAGAALVALGVAVGSQVLSAPATTQNLALQCITDAYRWHANHPTDALPSSCSKTSGAEAGGYHTRILGDWDDFLVVSTAPSGARTVTFSRGGQGMSPSPRMRMSEKICTPDHTYCCVWTDDRHSPKCGINTGGPL